MRRWRRLGALIVRSSVHCWSRLVAWMTRECNALWPRRRTTRPCDSEIICSSRMRWRTSFFIERSVNKWACPTSVWVNSMSNRRACRSAHDIARGHRVLPLMFHDGKLVIATDDPADNEKMSRSDFGRRKRLKSCSRILQTSIPQSRHITPPLTIAALESEADQLLEQHPKPVVASIERLHRRSRSSGWWIICCSTPCNDVHRTSTCTRASTRPTYATESTARCVASVNSIEHFCQVWWRASKFSPVWTWRSTVYRRTAQFTIAAGGPVDMRVSVMPSIHGENVVIRILDPRVGLRRLGDIGFTPVDERRFRVAHRPQSRTRARHGPYR